MNARVIVRIYLFMLAIVAIVVGAVCVFAQSPLAQEPDRAAKLKWIHANARNCCDHNDCHPAKIEWRPEGWRIEGADNHIEHRHVILWPFAEPYACIVNRFARCLFGSNGG